MQYNQYWNIGFCEQTPEELIRDKQLKPVRWLNHPYRDRWFADPFIYKVTESEIVVFVEECPMESPKGIICELVIDKETMRLKERYVMLELESHLSYPAIVQYDGKIYVYPENGASGRLYIYEYNGEKHILENPICILDEAVADATIIDYKEHFYMSATMFPKTLENAFLYESESLFGPFRHIGDKPYQTDRNSSRQGGNWMVVDNNIYRPAQDCMKNYGAALNVMNLKMDDGIIFETIVFRLNPVRGRYGLGLHTINFSDGWCVVDGYGFYMRLLGGFYYLLRRVTGKK